MRSFICLFEKLTHHKYNRFNNFLFISNMECDYERDNESMETDEQDDFVYTVSYEKTKTRRGTDAILFGKATYVLKQKNIDTIYWRCINRKLKEIIVQQPSHSLLIEEFVTYFVDTWFEGPLSV